MLRCEICSVEPQTDLLTRCCKLFVCLECREKYEKAALCSCGKPVSKKLCTPSPLLWQIINNYYQEKDEECDRCDDLAEVECKNCVMLFCARCNGEVHNGRGFAKHKREPYVRGSNPKIAAEKQRKKEEWCKEHRQTHEVICECGAQLCGMCAKTHRDSCSKTGKTRSLKEYRDEYFSQILFKIKQITEYKERLLEEKKRYAEHQAQQEEVFANYKKLMEEQLEGLKKILEVKTQEVTNRLNDYWRHCDQVYQKNRYVIDYYLKKYDDYGRLTEKFMEKTVGLDYLEKRVKRIYIAHDFFNFKVTGIDDIQASIIGLTSSAKEWESKHENILLSFDSADEKVQVPVKEKKMDLLGNLAGNSEFLLECSQNPLNHRPLALKASHNQIQFEFLHLPYQNDTYEIEYGIGLKNKGQEIFKKITNANGLGVLDYLNPSTKYRVRMRVSGGDWGPVNEIKTQDLPRLVIEGSLIRSHLDSSVQMLKQGVVYGSNEINFGVHEWELKIFPAKHNEEETACISIGVSNKEQRKPVFVGSTFNYGYHKAVITVRITLNCEENRLTLLNSSGAQEEVFQNLPNYPIYPAVQNKGSHPVQIQCTFL